MDTQEIVYSGVLGDGWQESDYQLLGGVLDLPIPRNTFATKKIQYHQPDCGKNSCTVNGAIGTTSDLTAIEWSLRQIKEVWAVALTIGADESWGWYLKNAADLVRKKMKEFFGIDLTSFVFALDSDEAMDALDKGYTLFVGFRGNPAYTADKNDDGVLAGTNFKPATYGHAIRLTPGGEVEVLAVDNYVKTAKHNTYKISKENLKTLVKNSVFFRMAYVFAYTEDVDLNNLPKNVPVWAVKSWDKAIKKGIETEQSNPLQIVGDKEDEEIWVKLGKLNKAEGNITRLRRAVLLDRMGLLD